MKVLDQEGNVRAPFAQGRHLERKHVQAVEQIGAEDFGRDGLLQIPVGRGNDADIGANGSAAADPFELSLLQHPQEGHLGLCRQFADLVEKDCAPVSQFEPALPPLRRAGEGPLFMAEQLGCDERRRHRGAVHTDEGTRGSRRPLMDRARDEFLARYRFRR